MSLFPILFLLLWLSGCTELQRWGVALFTPEYKAEAGTPGAFTGPDTARKQHRVRLGKVFDGLASPTDMAFLPSGPLLITEKGGKLRVRDAAGRLHTLLTLPVSTTSEQGLLGVALHPGYAKNGYLFLNYTVPGKQAGISRVSRFTVENPGAPWKGKVRQEKILLEVEQPWQNHNAGALVFGPDKMLYIPWGDGGFRGDPGRHGQNPATPLGSLWRIDVDGSSPGKAYGIPADNPFLKTRGFLPETWAYGFRNPWKLSFAPDGRLILADVGQDLWEEIDIVRRGGNYGWPIREGTHCYEDDPCRAKGLIPPVYEYGREDGVSVTGGYVYNGADRVLRGRYIFGDFVSGRLWALNLQPPHDVIALGRWPLLISTFASRKGEIWLADYGGGGVYRLLP